MANMKCQHCQEPFGAPHKQNCYVNSSRGSVWAKVENEDCATEQVVADTVAADSLESPSELSLHLSDRLNFEDKL